MTVLRSTCLHKLVAQSWYFTNIQTASQFAGPVATRQLLSHCTVNRIVVVVGVDSGPITRLFAEAMFAANKRM